MITPNDLTYDVACLGAKKILTTIMPIHHFVDGKKTDTITGYRYMISLPNLGFRKLGVRIPGKQLIQLQGNNYPLVEFDNLQLGLYERQGKSYVTAKASNIRIIDTNGKA
ncbi:hypothetical protein [Anaerotignum sp.]